MAALVDACQRASKSFVLRPTDFDLTKCGIPQAPNVPFVDLYRVYAYSTVLGSVGSSTAILPDEKKTVDCDSDFFLWNITILAQEQGGMIQPQFYVRFQWPWGRYFSNVLQEWTTFNGVTLAKDCDGNTCPLRIPAGRDIGIELQNPDASPINVSIFFEGEARYYLCR